MNLIKTKKIIASVCLCAAFVFLAGHSVKAADWTAVTTGTNQTNFTSAGCLKFTADNLLDSIGKVGFQLRNPFAGVPPTKSADVCIARDLNSDSTIDPTTECIQWSDEGLQLIYNAWAWYYWNFTPGFAIASGSTYYIVVKEYNDQIYYNDTYPTNNYSNVSAANDCSTFYNYEMNYQLFEAACEACEESGSSGRTSRRTPGAAYFFFGLALGTSFLVLLKTR